MKDDSAQSLDAEFAALVGGDTPEERWRARPEHTRFDRVEAFVLYHLNATTDDDFAGDFGITVGTSGRTPGEQEHPLPVYHVVLGVERSTGRRLSNVLVDATGARELAAQLTDAANEVDKRHAKTWTPKAKERYMDQLRRALLPQLTDEQLLAGGLSEDEIREIREMNTD